jgi:hypothetical protein
MHGWQLHTVHASGQVDAAQLELIIGRIQDAEAVATINAWYLKDANQAR